MKTIPNYLLKPIALEIYPNIKESFERFLLIGHIICKFNKNIKSDLFTDYPFKFEGRDVYSWNIGDTVVIEDNRLCVL